MHLSHSNPTYVVSSDKFMCVALVGIVVFGSSGSFRRLALCVCAAAYAYMYAGTDRETVDFPRSSNV